MTAFFCCFRASPRRASHALQAIEAELETGDVMLFSTTGTDDILTRLGSWHQSSQSGFLIRKGAGIAGLQLCHPNFQQGQSPGNNTQTTPIAQFFSDSAFDTVIIRKLCTPLTEEQKRQLQSFVEACQEMELGTKVTLLMKRPDLPRVCGSLPCFRCSKRTVERFICSELVVKMLLHLDLVSGNKSEYFPVVPSKDSRRVGDSTLYEAPLIVKWT